MARSIFYECDPICSYMALSCTQGRRVCVVWILYAFLCDIMSQLCSPELRFSTGGVPGTFTESYFGALIFLSVLTVTISAVICLFLDVLRLA